MKAWLRRGGIAAVIALATALVYWPARRGTWLWDDGLEVSENPVVKAASGWWTAWTHPLGMDYFPLKSSFQWAAWQLWPNDPAAFHALSVALHVIAALLLWRVLAGLGLRFGWVGALLFALHPVAVESVAWISEQKNLWSLILLLISLIWFEKVERDLRARWRGRRCFYLLSVAAFIAALLCKSTVVMLPVFLLVLAWWRRGRIARLDVLRAIPFALVALILGLVTLHFQSQRAVGTQGPLPDWSERWSQAGWSALAYLRELFAPRNLAPIYAPVRTAIPAVVPWVLIALLFAWFAARSRGWGRHALLGCGWIALNLLPVLGLIPMAYLRIAPRADHLAYLGIVGAAGLGAAVFQALISRGDELRGLAARLGAGVLLGIILIYGAITSRAEAAHFQTERSLWSWAVERNPQSWLAHSNLGRVWLNDRHPTEALREFAMAAGLRPDSAEVHANLGSTYDQLGRTAEARQQLQTAVSLDPQFAGGHYDLGELTLRSGDVAGSIPELRRAIELNPAYAAAHNNLGLALARSGDVAGALVEYRRALTAAPELPEAHLNLGNLLARSGQYSAAIQEFRTAIRISPGYVAAHRNLAATLQWLGQTAEAARERAEASRWEQAGSPR